MSNNDLIKELARQAYHRGYAEGVLIMVATTCPAEGSEQHKHLQEIVAGMIEGSI